MRHDRRDVIVRRLRIGSTGAGRGSLDTFRVRGKRRGQSAAGRNASVLRRHVSRAERRYAVCDRVQTWRRFSRSRGQELNLGAPASAATAAPSTVATAPVQERPLSTTVTPLPPPTQPSRPANPPPASKPVASSPMFENVEPESTPVQPPAATVQAPPPNKPPVVAEAEPPPKPVELAPQLNAGGVSWHWPAAGNVIGTYVSGDQTKQGVDIAGNEGDPITATADGEVVYSGNGLIGYGELIIIKHNASFLSAYGHNRKRLVQEGDKVKAGQRIAEMGASAAARNELHFEIRKNGKPVNPLEYLPVR